MENLKLNLSKEKIEEMKQLREKYIQKLNFAYEENCSFEMLEFLNESSYTKIVVQLSTTIFMF